MLKFAQYKGVVMIKPMTVDPDLYSMRAIRETAAYMDGIL